MHPVALSHPKSILLRKKVIACESLAGVVSHHMYWPGEASNSPQSSWRHRGDQWVGYSLFDGEASCRGSQDLENWEGHCGCAQLQPELSPWKVEGPRVASRALEAPREVSGLYLQGLRFRGSTFQNSLQGLQDSALVVPHVIISELKQAVEIFLLVGHVVHEVRGGFPCEIHLPGLELSRAAPDACPRVRGELGAGTRGFHRQTGQSYSVRPRGSCVPRKESLLFPSPKTTNVGCNGSEVRGVCHPYPPQQGTPPTIHTAHGCSMASQEARN